MVTGWKVWIEKEEPEVFIAECPPEPIKSWHEPKIDEFGFCRMRMPDGGEIVVNTHKVVSITWEPIFNNKESTDA